MTQSGPKRKASPKSSGAGEVSSIEALDPQKLRDFHRKSIKRRAFSLVWRDALIVKRRFMRAMSP